MDTQSASPENFEAVYQRAHLLYDQGRFEDAAEWFQRALAMEPEHGIACAYLAMCWCQREQDHPKAIEAARQAVSLEPENAFVHSVLAICLLDSAKPGQEGVMREGLASAEKAVELDPDLSLAFSVRGHAHLRLRKYAEAEADARQALSLDTTDTMATQVLSVALMQQRKDADVDSLVNWQLQENPEDDHPHVAAGYRALQQGRHREASSHFGEALRIDPENEMARHGLIESMRSRNFIYRWYYQFASFMQRFGEGKGTAIMIGGYVVYRVVLGSIKDTQPALAGILIGTWLTFALWTFLARGLGSLLMLTDRFARLAMKPKEKWEGIVVGGMILIALALLVITIAYQSGMAGYFALLTVITAVPCATAFSNQHHLGRWLFGGAAVVALVCLVLHALPLVPGAEDLGFLPDETGGIALLIGVITTWLTAFRVMYR